MIAPRKILCIKLRSLGDTILMTAPLMELRKAYPDAQIDVVVTQNWASLLEHHPAVDKIWQYVRHRETTARAKAIARLALMLRKERYDWVVAFHASPSSSALAYALGAKVRSIHFHGHKDKNRYSTVEIPGKGVLKPIIERDMDTIRALGLDVPAGRLPQVFPQPSEIEKARNRLALLRLDGPLLCMGIGASRPTKSWDLARFASVAIRWVDQNQGSVLCFSSRDEAEQAQALFSHIDEKLLSWYQDRERRAWVRSRIANEVELPLRLMAALMSQARVTLGNDSGPRHLAVAVGCPTVTLFGPEDPFEWHPYPKDKHPYFFVEGLKCRNDQDPGYRPWCGLNTCTVEEHRCMKLISEDDVFKTVASL